MKRVDILGVPCWFRGDVIDESFLKIRKKVSEKADICPLCNEGFEVGQEINWVMNNFKLFPNIFAHYECIKNAGGFEEAGIKMMNSYREYTEMLQKFKAWT